MQVREWREKQYQEEKEKEQEKKKAEFEHKRERQQLVKDYLDRKERRELKKQAKPTMMLELGLIEELLMPIVRGQVDMETIEHDKDEEEANQVETASLAKGDKVRHWHEVVWIVDTFGMMLSVKSHIWQSMSMIFINISADLSTSA